MRKVAAGIYSFLPLGWRVVAEDRAHHPRGDEPRRRAGGVPAGGPSRPSCGRSRAAGSSTAPSSCASRTARAPTSSSARRTRRSIVRPGARRRAQLPPAAAEPLPDPDQVPRRAAAARRPDARARVHHEGRLLVPRRRRGRAARVPEHVRRLRAHLHAAAGSTSAPSRPTPAPSAARCRTSSRCWPRPARTRSSPATAATTPPTSRRRSCGASRERRRRRTAALEEGRARRASARSRRCRRSCNVPAERLGQDAHLPRRRQAGGGAGARRSRRQRDQAQARRSGATSWCWRADSGGAAR